MYAFLVGYWLIFWQRFLRNPYLLCTSELATTNFPHWLWMGRKWRAKDDLYYRFPACIPFLSMWYWPSVLVSKLSRFLCLDNAFRLYAYFILAHYLLASIIAYKALGLFGAITLTYAGYCIKPQTPSFVYTMTWMPGMLIGGPIGWISCAMAVTGGYWPILVYFMPVAALVNPSSLLGLVLAIPQIIAFAWYWKRSIRSGEKVDRNLGKLPWWKLRDLFWPSKSVSLVNGVHYPEAEMYMGIAVLFIWKVSWWWVPLILGAMIAVGLIPPVQRISARTLYLISFSIAIFSASAIHNLSPNIQLGFLSLQLYLLYRNSSIYPSFPFSQWWNKPSKIYPNADYTGYLTSIKKNSYRGAFALKEPAWMSA